MQGEKMNEHEEKFIEAFIVKEKRARYRLFMDNPKRRSKFLDCLNHNHDLEMRFASELPDNANIVEILRKHGSPQSVYVISPDDDLDGNVFSLQDILVELTFGGGAFISCIPGRLGLYYSEDIEANFLLKRHITP